MKEILYLDTDIMNSLLAQLDQGLIDAFTLEEISQMSQGTSVQSKLGAKIGAHAGVDVDSGALPGGGIKFGFSAGGNESESEMNSKEVIDGQRDLLNKRFHDYALNILISRLEQDELIVEENYKEGDLIKVTANFDFYDFSLINIATNPKLWREMISWDNSIDTDLISADEAERIFNKVKKKQTLSSDEKKKEEDAIRIHEKNLEVENIVNIMRSLGILASTANELFKDLTLIKSNNLVGLLKKQFLRESTEALSFRGNHTRKAIFLGRIIGVKSELASEDNITDFSPHELNKIPNVLLDLLLGSFDIIENDNILISPIAIYYE